MRTRSSFDTARPAVPRGSRPITRLTPGLSAGSIGLVMLLAARAASPATITVDASNSPSGNPHFWSTCVGTGTASLSLRADLQTHYKLGARELGMQRVRGHGILNDDMGVYKGAGSYDWTKFDTYIKAIQAAGMQPIIELSFMPTALASSGNNKNPPKDQNTYKQFIQDIVAHCVSTYGSSVVQQWYWEVWNEPNYTGFWTGTQADYFTMYDSAAAGAVAALPNIQIGGPVTTPGSASYITAFLNHVKSSGARVTFASSHGYADGPSANAPANFGVDDNTGRLNAITSAGYSTATIKSLNTEWSSSYSGQGGNTNPNCVSMDNYQQAAFILKTCKLLAEKNSGNTPPLEVFSYWVISDVFDESGGPSGSYILGQTANGTLPFGSVFGLTTFQGMRKAAFNGFKMLNYLGPKRLAVSGGTGTADGVDAFAAMSANNDEVQVAVYNYYKTVNTTGSDDSVTVTVNNLPFTGQAYVTRFIVDNTHSNPYSVWTGQSKPTNPSESQWQAMRAAQHLALAQAVTQTTVSSSYSTTFTLPKQGSSLIIVGKARPLTGRDALVEMEGEDYDGQSGATKEESGDTSMGQSISVNSGGSVFFNSVDFRDAGVGSVQLRVKASSATTLELRQDSQTGTLLGTCSVASTGSSWATQTCNLTQTAGVHNLYVVSGGSVHLNWMKFQAGGGGQGTGGTGAGGQASGGSPPTGGTATGGRATGGTSVTSGGTSVATGGVAPATGGTTSATGGTGVGGASTSGGTGGGGSPETCNCRTTEGGSGRTPGWLVALSLLFLRRARRSSQRIGRADETVLRS